MKRKIKILKVYNNLKINYKGNLDEFNNLYLNKNLINCILQLLQNLCLNKLIFIKN